MDKSSKPSVIDRKERHVWRPTAVANVYMRGKKYYYVKMNRSKRHFVPLADSQGSPFPIFLSKVAINPFVERPELGTARERSRTIPLQEDDSR